MRSPNKVTTLLATTAAMLGSANVAHAKKVNKAPQPSIARVAQVALDNFYGADNANFLSKTHRGMFYDYENADGSITEVTIKSNAAKNGYPDPEKAWFVDATTFTSGTHPEEGGIAPVSQLTVSRQGGEIDADKAVPDPSDPETMNVTEARVGHGIQTFDHVYTPGDEGLDYMTNDVYHPGSKAAQNRYTAIAHQLISTIQRFGE